MISIFTVPDREKEYQSHMVYMLTIIWTLFIIITVSMGLFYFPHLSSRWITFIGAALFIGFINLTLIKLGYTRQASIFLTLMVWLLVTMSCYTAGGIMAPGIASQVSVILTAGFLLGGRGGLAIGLLTIGIDFGMVYMELNGTLPIPSVIHNPLTRWVGIIIPIGTILALQYYATEHLRSGIIALKAEVVKRKMAERLTNQSVNSLEKRVNELKALSEASRILQDDETPLKNIFSEILNILPAGWQYPDITAARVCFSGMEYTSDNYKPSQYCQLAKIKTDNGSLLSIEVLYLQQVPEMFEGPFMKEERKLIDMLVEMVKMNLERRDRSAELKDYKYALDTGYMVSISGADQRYTYVNDNFCKISKYSPAELLDSKNEIIVSDFHPSGYYEELFTALNQGRSYRGEFCNKAKDDTLYWLDTTIVPFLDENGKVYQYLSINHDITERKFADDQIKKSEQTLRKITSQIPSNTYVFEITASGNVNIHFMSIGNDMINFPFDAEDVTEYSEVLRKIVHDDDKIKFNDALKEAFRTQSAISFQYRIVIDGNVRWRWLQATPEKEKNGKIIWYGASNDISPIFDYIASIEQIIFDIAHVIRRPVSSMLGMSKLIIDGVLNENEIKDISQKLYLISEEMDKFINKLNQDYQQKRKIAQLNFDFSPLINKRDGLFK